LGSGNNRWRSFEEAREFVRNLGLENSAEWMKWAKSDHKTADIPAVPRVAYKDEWQGVGDWLYGDRQEEVQEARKEVQRARKRKKWRPFEEAREFVQGLGLRSVAEWTEYAKSGQKPEDIPATPKDVYADKWLGTSDWLATGRRTPRDSYRGPSIIRRGAGVRPWAGAEESEGVGRIRQVWREARRYPLGPLGSLRARRMAQHRRLAREARTATV